MSWIRGAALAALALVATVPQTYAQGASTWFLAEGANNATFSEEILVGNPSAQAVKVTVTLLPQSDAIAPTLAKTFDLAASARLTVRLGERLRPERQRLGARHRGARQRQHHAGRRRGRTDHVLPGRDAARLAQRQRRDAGGALADLDARRRLGRRLRDVRPRGQSRTRRRPIVRATYLTGTGQSFVDRRRSRPANSRLTFYPRGEHAALATADFSTQIESLTGGNNVIAERAMYFDAFRSGHDALGVTSPSTTWLFAEGFTGGNAATAFETYLLLANTNATETVATVDYLLDTGAVVSRNYTLGPRQRFTVWVDQEGRDFDARLKAAAFGIRVTATQPIVAERAMYWGTPSASDVTSPTFPWTEGHATAGVPSGQARWAFAEGQQGTFGAAATRYDTFFLLANPNNVAVQVQATFVREDGKGIVRTICVAPNSRNNIWTQSYPELVRPALRDVPRGGRQRRPGLPRHRRHDLRRRTCRVFGCRVPRRAT